jgi:type III restriction enzyme
MKPKDYQTRTLETVRSWLDALVEMREKSAKLAAVDADLAASFDFPEAAWKKVSDRAYQKRRTGNGDPLPSACIKIPTGGGKTYIATRMIDLANTIYLRRQHGLVLWIVPSTQIYNQTLAALRDRSHPYRQQLDIASANRTLILEKNRKFRPEDVRESLCVLLLMLPSANRETKETLRMFRDSGGFERFFPRDGEHAAHAELLKLVPNLDAFGEGGGGLWKRQIKTSLGNTLRLLRPIVILDEGHRAQDRFFREAVNSACRGIFLLQCICVSIYLPHEDQGNSRAHQTIGRHHPHGTRPPIHHPHRSGRSALLQPPAPRERPQPHRIHTPRPGGHRRGEH